MKKLLIIFILLSFTLVSCEEDIKYFDLNVVFLDKLSDLNVGDEMPDNLSQLLDYIYIKDEDSECAGKYFVPRIFFERKDLSEKERIDFPIREGVFAGENTITVDELNENYDQSLIKITKLLLKDGKKKAGVPKSKFLKLELYDSDKSKIEKLKKEIEKLLCNNTTQITLLVVDNSPELSIETTTNSIQTLINQADDLFAQKKYQEAKSVYEQVLSMVSNNDHVRVKIQECLQQLQKNDQKEQMINQADKLFQQKNYKAAKKQYVSINKQYPNIQHVIDRINEINKLLIPPGPDKGPWVRTGASTMKSNYAKYEGGIVDGKMHGSGSLVFTRTHIVPVPPNSKKMVTIQKGYKLVGTFFNGYLVSGTIYNKKGVKQKAIYIGR